MRKQELNINVFYSEETEYTILDALIIDFKEFLNFYVKNILENK